MSKENAMRFLMAKDKNENIKSALDTVLSKYEGINLSGDDWDKVLQEEVIPLAKTNGYDFSPKDLKEIQSDAGEKLSDEELDGISGGSGQFTIWHSFYSKFVIIRNIISCKYVPDDATFESRYYATQTDCSYYQYSGCGANIPSCVCCANCSYKTVL